MSCLASSKTNLRGPHEGCRRRSTASSTSTPPSIWCGHDRGRCEPSPSPSSPPASYLASQLCTVCLETPNRAATSVTVSPSLITANTAWYRCSATLISRIHRECQESTGVGVNHQPEHRQPSPEAKTSSIRRRFTWDSVPQAGVEPATFRLGGG